MGRCRMLHELAESLDSKGNVRTSIREKVQLANVSLIFSRVWQRNSISGKKLAIKGKRCDS